LYGSLKGKSFDEIVRYGNLVIRHMSEPSNDSEIYSDGIPKEGVRSKEVLIRIMAVHLFRQKIKETENKTFDIEEGGWTEWQHFWLGQSKRLWTKENDRNVIIGVLKHGYGKWMEISQDSSLDLLTNLYDQLRMQHHTDETNKDEQPLLDEQQQQQLQDKPSDSYVRTPFSDSLVSKFIRKRVLLLENALNVEYQIRLWKNNQRLLSSNVQIPTPVNTSSEPSKPGRSTSAGNSSHKLSTSITAVGDAFNLSDPSELKEDNPRFKFYSKFKQLDQFVHIIADEAQKAYGGNKNSGVRFRKDMRLVEGLIAQIKTELGTIQKTTTAHKKVDPSAQGNSKTTKSNELIKQSTSLATNVMDDELPQTSQDGAPKPLTGSTSPGNVDQSIQTLNVSKS